jgi:hypothetical protein
VKDLSEIYSIMRSFPLSKKVFLDRHYDDDTFYSSMMRDA